MKFNVDLLKDYLADSNKTIDQVITDTAILSEICELLKLYYYKSGIHQLEHSSEFLFQLNKEDKIIKKKNTEAKNIYSWLHGKDFNIHDCAMAEYKNDPKKLLRELRNLVKCWDEDDENDFMEEGVTNAFQPLQDLRK